jgi:hypothetical protein
LDRLRILVTEQGLSDEVPNSSQAHKTHQAARSILFDAAAVAAPARFRDLGGHNFRRDHRQYAY